MKTEAIPTFQLSKPLQLALLLALATFSAAVPGRARTLTIEPEQPTTADVLQVIFHDDEWHSVCEPLLGSVTVQGGEIRLEVVPPPGGCILVFVDNPYTLTAEVGPLPAGTYEAVVEFGDLSLSTEVTVGSSGEPPPSLAGLGCAPAQQPAATLLLPYFEVDLADPGGRNTLFSVNNAAASPRVAHVVVWTNRAVPVLSFDLALAADGSQPISLRSVIEAGSIVETSLPPEAASSFPGCATPIEVPALAGPALIELQAQMGGQSDGHGICVASPVEGGQVITGFITIDAVSDCSGAALRHPGAVDDPSYFVDGGHGLATNENVLWGDYFLIDPGGNSAQGLALVPVVADAARFGIETATFYKVGVDNRAPLGTKYRARFLRGGGFDGETDILVWIQGGTGVAQDCLPEFGELGLSAIFRDEAGAFAAQFGTFGVQRVLRLRVGEEPWPVDVNFGTVDLAFESYLGGTTEPFPEEEQGFVVPILRAEGRFSVGYDAVQLSGFCP